MCKTDLVDNIGGEPKITGVRAHITARQEGGPRYDPELEPSQRNGYANLMLLCGLCHTKVDAAPAHYTVAKLHSIKADHEHYCSTLLTVDDERRAIKGEILANAVDIVVEGLSLDRWDEWTCNLLNPGLYRWPQWAVRYYHTQVRPAVEGVIWPKGTESLEVASKMLVDAVIALWFTFAQRSALEKDPDDSGTAYFVCNSQTTIVERYYGADWRAFKRVITDWDATLELGLAHVTKCVNWYAETVREHLNPRFRTTDGAFRMEPTGYGSHGVVTFTATEKMAFLTRGYEALCHDGVWEIVRDCWAAPPQREFDALL
jgi:hypothetical protein